jgi:glycosyltransferase involved in cell wall biosynthesis
VEVSTHAGKRSRVAYVTDLEPRVSGGGSNVVNWHAFDQLRNRFDCAYIGPIVPRPPAIEVFQSRLRRRILRRAGSFAYFSPATLDSNASMVAQQLSGDEDAIFFRSATRWCRTRPRAPYFVYLDAVFHTFFHNTFRPEEFDAKDIDRIFREETEFLENAAGVFFESKWGMERAVDAYGLSRSHYSVAGRGGAVDPPLTVTWPPESRDLLTVAMDFQLKGGDIVLAAFEMLKPQFPSLTWSIIGGKPPHNRLPEGVTYQGALDPHHPEEGRKFRELLAKAWLLVHPTREDTSPLVITEAAYFGCPAVSVNAFAIPELVEHDKSGVLLDPPVSPNDLADVIRSLLTDDARYRQMRQHARQDAVERHSWSSVGQRICDTMETSMDQGIAPAR